jgi:hypothetical protein
MLAKIISALALTLLLTGGALAYVPQPQEGLQTELCAAEPHNVYAGHSYSVETSAVSEEFVDAAEPHDIYAGHSNSVKTSAVSEKFADAAEPNDIYAGDGNSVEPQESLQTQLFAADTVLSEPRQFD